MRILQIHNVYQQAGGEDAVVDAEHAMLTQAGHRVERYSISNDAIVSLRDKVRTALDAAWSAKQYARIHARLADDRPDVVHVHNTFPTITPAVFHACHDLAVPVVATLHNYRLARAAATLLRDGRPCERCLTGTAYWGAAYACYRGSWLGSLATAHMIQRHRRLGTWRDKVDRLIVLTEFQKGKMIAAGIPAERLVVKPNFLANPPSAAEPPARRHGALFVGRLAPEKGVGLLLEAWQRIEYPLTIIGTGPLEQELRGLAPQGVTFRRSTAGGGTRRDAPRRIPGDAVPLVRGVPDDPRRGIRLRSAHRRLAARSAHRTNRGWNDRHHLCPRQRPGLGSCRPINPTPATQSWRLSSAAP